MFWVIPTHKSFIFNISWVIPINLLFVGAAGIFGGGPGGKKGLFAGGANKPLLFHYIKLSSGDRGVGTVLSFHFNGLGGIFGQ